ncbi:Proline porter II [Actinomadura madurae]|nr:Proline porter II [Actinomadura madurae]
MVQQMENEHDRNEVKPAALRKAIFGGAIGNAVEWFDYTVYGYLAVVIGGVFFPSDNPTASLLASFAVFAIAFAVRPLGGFFFGSLGDRMGRQRTLATVVLLMSGATFAVGLLPGHSTIGILAPVLLVALRLLQGFSAGGEVPGGASLLAEYAPPGRRGFVTCLLQAGSGLGIGLSAVTVLILNSSLSESAMESWGWRVPFLLAGPIGVIGLYIRLRLEDTPDFLALKEAGETSKAPLTEAISGYWRRIIRVIGLTLVQVVSFYIVLVYAQTYFTGQLGFSSTTASVSVILTLVVQVALIPVMGVVSDRIGRRPVLAGASLGFAVLTYPMFVLMNTGALGAAMAGLLVLAVLLAVFQGAAMATLTELFPTRVRYAGFSVGYNVSTALFGGTTPYLAAYLISTTDDHFAPGYYLIVAAVVSLISALTLTETAKTPLSAT